MILHEANKDHGKADMEFLPMEMLALTPCHFNGMNSGEAFPHANEDNAFPLPFFAFGDSDDDEDDMEEDDFDDMEEDDFDDDEDDFDEEDDDDEDEEDFDDDDDYDYDEDDDFEYDDE